MLPEVLVYLNGDDNDTIWRGHLAVIPHIGEVLDLSDMSKADHDGAWVVRKVWHFPATRTIALYVDKATAADG